MNTTERTKEARSVDCAAPVASRHEEAVCRHKEATIVFSVLDCNWKLFVTKPQHREKNKTN